MQIACPTCDKRLQIADEKLPTDRKVRITCPACQENFTYNANKTIVLSVPPRMETPSHQESALVDPTPTRTVPPPARSAALSVPTSNLNVIEAGLPPRALVCVDDTIQRRNYDEMLAALRLSTIHMMDEQVQAMTYLTQVVYDIVILDANFDGSTLEANPVLACVAEIPMVQRRHMFVAICTDQPYAYDTIEAYSQNANLFFSYTDPHEVLRAFEQGMADHKRLYHLYWDVCQELGKE
jgi:CheY-like chemotaxis protein